ncbi:MAG: energy transducer TonB [Akkermansiaceae bacterium]|nr:energy transducer TonB [Akkermansiaceae bacterium]
MNVKSTITGIAASAILLAVLGVARLFTVTTSIPDLTIREVETATFEPPPPPPPREDIPDTPPPPPALMEVSALPESTMVPIPKALVPMDITAPVEDFFTDLAPAPLPTRIAPASKPTYSKPDRPKLPPAVKSQYNAGELDGMPRVLRHGTATFPSSLARKGITRGTIVFSITISVSGAVSIQGVVSSTHPELIASARRVASGARFTPPLHNGKPVKAVMNWPIVIEK